MRVRPEPLLLAVLAGASWAQGAPSSAFSARLGSTLVVSDNFLSNAEGKDGGALLQVSPGFDYTRRTSAVQASISYGLNLMAPWRVVDRPETVQHQLNSRVRLSSPASGLSLDGLATISQQNASAFGQQRAVGALPTAGTLNQNEVYQVALSPSWQTRLGGLSDVQVAHRLAASNTRNSSLGDATTQDTSVGVASLQRGGLQWSLRASRTETKPKVGLRTKTESAGVFVNWQPDIDWQFNANAGKDRSDLRRSTGESGTSYGLGAIWAPTPRTQLVARMDERVYGRTHVLSFTQRFRRVSVSVSESKSVSEPGVVGAVSSRSNYQLLFDQLATVQPDPVLRDLLVRQQLQALGLDPNGLVSGGLISSRPTLTGQRFLSTAWTGARFNASLLLSRADTTRFGEAGAASDDLSRTSRVRQSSASLAFGYRLGATSSLSANWQWQQNEGDTSALSARSESASLSWTTRIASRQQLSVSLRHADYLTAREPATENALTLSYQHQF